VTWQAHSDPMKDQYFGDARDYVKYEVLEELMASILGLQRLVCLWMLTPPDDSGEGNVRFVARPEVTELATFLNQHIDAGDRRIKHLRSYFGERGIEYVPWGDEPPYFTTQSRRRYFRDIPQEQLQGALLFCDPDIGLTARAPTTKHLAFDELLEVRNRTDSNSVTVVYQHRQRLPNFWELRAAEIRERLVAPVAYLAETSVALFVIPKRAEQVDAINGCLRRVAARLQSRDFGPA
jgi:hypothetical protein